MHLSALTVSSLSIITFLSNLHMVSFDQQTFEYDRCIVVLTKRAANKNLKVNNADENFLPSFHCFLLRSSGFII